MARKPQQSQLATWSIYRAAKKVMYLGEIEAADEREALGKGTEKFDTDAARLIAVAAPVIAAG